LSVTTRANILYIYHFGHGDKAQGTSITDAMRTAMVELKKTYRQVAVYHDVAGLESVGDDYVRAFARLAREWGNEGMLYVAVVPKTWVRIFAKRAASLGGITTHFFKTYEEARNFLRQHGFSPATD
jgi:hypothetical protein